MGQRHFISVLIEARKPEQILLSMGEGDPHPQAPKRGALGAAPLGCAGPDSPISCLPVTPLGPKRLPSWCRKKQAASLTWEAGPLQSGIKNKTKSRRCWREEMWCLECSCAGRRRGPHPWGNPFLSKCFRWLALLIKAVCFLLCPGWGVWSTLSRPLELLSKFNLNLKIAVGLLKPHSSGSSLLLKLFVLLYLNLNPLLYFCLVS